ncbi:MAG TPA: response regulator [Ktedonobacteraceae bacterium]
MMEKSLYRVLIAEDEEIARRALRLVCEKSGCPVEVVFEAATGRQVVEALGRLRPDIILMDVVLPGVDGLTATRYAHQLYPATKVAIISAYDKFEYAQEALRAGAVDYLLKPVRSEQLVALLKKLCANLDAEDARKVTAPNALEEAGSGHAQRSPHYAALKRAEAYIAKNYAHGLTLGQVAAHADMAPTYFSRIFKQELGCTYTKYLTRIRLEEAKRLLSTTTLPVAEIAYAVGYLGPNYLTGVFKAVEGITPGIYRRTHSQP